MMPKNQQMPKLVTPKWQVERACSQDWPEIWAIFQEVVKKGDTYSYAPDTSEALAKSVWDENDAQAFVVRHEGQVIATYSLRRNHFGLAAHVANAAYMVREDFRSQGIARAMCMDSLKQAKALGCLSMQFNFVVSTNQPAVALWQNMGFTIIGVSPKSYKHAQQGYVDIFIMHRFLDDTAL
jgi:L-amino acid N-acyltransferase YncA